MSNSKKSRLGNQPQFIIGKCSDEITTPSFSPQAVIPQQQSPQGAGTSLTNYDGGPEPTHARGVSPQKPEIIASLDFAPMFIFKSRGRKLLTPEGLLLDTQLSARKVRINDIRSLIEKLLEDPESPQGIIINDLISALEGELLGAQSDIDVIKQISSRKSSLISVFNLKRTSEGVSNRAEEKRNQRFPDGRPSYLEANVDFIRMLLDNHGFSETDVGNFSNTKILYIVLSDIKALLSGPNTSKSFMSTQIGNDNQHRGASSFSSNPISLQIPPQGRPNLSKIQTMIDVMPREDMPFSTANLSPSTILQNPFLRPRGANASSLVNVDIEGGHAASEINLYRARVSNAGTAIAASIDAITSDFAASSAMGDNQFMSSVIGDSVVQGGTLLDLIFKNLPLAPDGSAESSKVDHFEITGDNSFTGAVMARLGEKILPVFDADPQLRSRFEEIGITPNQLSSISADILKPILSTVADGQPDVAALQELTEQIPAKLRSAADLIEKISGIGAPGLDPDTVLMDALRALRTTMEGMNLTESSLSLRQLLELNVLGEAYAVTQNKYVLEPHEGGYNIADPLEIFPITFHTLVVLLITALSKLRPGPSFADLIPSMQDGDAVLNGLVTRLKVQMRRTLTQCPVTGQGTDRSELASMSQAPSNITFTGGGSTDSVVHTGAVNSNSLAINPMLRASRVRNTVVDFKGVSDLIAAYAGNELKVETQYDGKAFQGTRFRIDASPSSSPGLGGAAAVIRPSYGYYAFRGEAFPANFQQILDAGGGVFSSIIDILEGLQQAALSRGPIVNSATGRMLSSGVDPSVHISLLVNVFSHLAYHLAHTYFSSVQPVGQSEEGSRYGKEVYASDGAIVTKVANITKFNRSLSDLQAFLDADGDLSAIPAGDSVLKNIVTSFRDHVFFKRKALNDFVDFFRSIAGEIEDSSQQFIESFSEERLPEAQLDSFKKVRSSIEIGVDYTQTILSQKKLDDINSHEGYRKYFDNFLTSQAEENYLYTLMHQGRFSDQNGSNLKIICVGIPYGFTRKVLGIDPTINPQGFNERRKVRISIRRKDLILGGTITTSPLHYDFDLGVFFDSVQDPIVGASQDSSIIDMNDVNSDVFGQINYHNSVTRRSYPDPGSHPGTLGPYQLGVSLKKINPHTGQTSILRYSNIDPTNTSQQRLFLNHVDDFLARLYARIAYGIDFSEDSFYIDSAVESLTSSTEEINKFSGLINAHIRAISGADLNLDDYLAGERKTRELFDRLTKDEKIKPITDIVEATVEGEPPDTNFLASEDLVVFSRMMGSNNPLIIPSTIRARITKPKLFERVFCILVDPDSFPIETDSADIPNDNDLINRYVFKRQNPPRYKPVDKKSGKIQASQFDAFVSVIE